MIGYPQQMRRVKPGRRGKVLLTLAFIDVIYAINIYLSIGDPDRSASTAYAREAAPLTFFACLWLLVAIVCLVSAFRVNDRLGWSAAILIKVLWGTLLVMGWLTGDVPLGYLSAAIWWGFGAIVWVVSRWPDLSKPGGV